MSGSSKKLRKPFSKVRRHSKKAYDEGRKSLATPEGQIALTVAGAAIGAAAGPAGSVAIGALAGGYIGSEVGKAATAYGDKKAAEKFERKAKKQALADEQASLAEAAAAEKAETEASTAAADKAARDKRAREIATGMRRDRLLRARSLFAGRSGMSASPGVSFASARPVTGAGII